MPDWTPIKHQLDALRMDVQYTLRQVIKAEERGKVYRSRRGDWLAYVMCEHHVLRQLDETIEGPKPALFKVTRLGRKVVNNDHACREIAMAWMDYLSDEQLLLIQHHLFQWPFRDPAVRKFMLEADGTDGGAMHD